MPSAEPVDATNAIAARTTPVPAPVRKHAYSSVDVNGPYIAITFDDGPHAVHTPKLLDMLKQRGIRATFYVLGSSVEAYPDIARRIVAEGHEIANHSWSHPALSKLSSAGVDSQIRRTNEVIKRVTGVQPTTMRPPYGATNARLNKRLDEEYGLKVILWSVDPLDWKYRNSSRVTQQILENTQAGGIVLAHDIHATTVDAMPATLDGLLAKGFKFVRVDELLKMERGGPSPDATAAATPFVVTRTEREP
jgi:peptidoglycan/xylan/chitin deacetylase (PgdA/CDA1 family)